ncbi:MAG: LysE family translocator [Phycicoccus sp.]
MASSPVEMRYAVELQFLVVVLAVVAAPGADFVVTLRNTVGGGASSGTATALGVGAASCLQGTLASLGLGALIVRSQPVFVALTWMGTAYLFFLAVQSLRSAVRGRYDQLASGATSDHRRRALRQGFLSNVTNPKMLVFYLSLLPQFVDASAPLWSWLVHAWTLPLLGTTWLFVVVILAGSLRDRLLRPLVRRVIDAVSGVALLGFGARLASTRA